MRLLRNRQAGVTLLAMVLAAIIFVVDLVTPLGLELSLAYVLPLLLVSRYVRPRQTFVLACLCSVLVLIDLFFSPPGIRRDYAIFNRMLAIGVLWVTWAILEQRRRAADALARASEEALHKSENRFRRLVDANIIGVVVADLDGHILDANGAFLELVGYSRPELLVGNTQWSEITPSAFAGLDLQALDELWVTGKMAPYEKMLYRRDGRQVPILIGGALLDSTTRTWVCFVLDLSEQKRMEDELRHAADELELRVQERTAELLEREATLRTEVRQREEAQAELHALSRHLVEAIEEERRAIARELHDAAGGALTALSLQLGLLESDPAMPSAIVERLAGLQHATQEIMEEFHNLVVNIRPASLDRMGLGAALEQYASQYRRQYALDLHLEIIGVDGIRLPSAVETALYRVAQEALTNVARHAQATHVDLMVVRHEHTVSVTVEDDGVGFHPTVACQSGRFGLMGMRERMEMLGGRLIVESAPGAGATIVAEVPCAL